ncbi:threonine and homoserine efflux system [Escherichia coli]|nr:threonine and homoserine efflux system [Escherichia coli]
MPGSLRKMPVWLPIVILLVAMASIQGGASLAKSLFLWWAHRVSLRCVWH